MIYVFKTSVPNIKAVKELKHYLDELVKKTKWNFNL